MANVIQRYLERRAEFSRWPLLGDPPAALEAVVVIPCLAESARLFDTLNDLAAQVTQMGQRPACPFPAPERTLVLCVVNNRPPGHARPEDLADNLRTLAALQSWPGRQALSLALVDAASPGRELPDDGGVGLARKIGLDWGLKLLHEAQAAPGILISLDADTRVAPAYLEDIFEFYRAPRWAGILPYAHPLQEGPELPAILCYEFFLRYQELGLRYAASPYAFHTIGSTITCTARAYAAVSGMNRRQAGEDFYFLQQLRKTGAVERIPADPVIPAARASHRVPFGTGRRIQRHLGASQNEYLLYHPHSFEVLRQWLKTVEHAPEASAGALLAAAEAITPALGQFLHQQKFKDAFGRIHQQTESPRQRLRQFHDWFDAFRTLKLLHHLRDHGYPDQEMFSALETLLAWMGSDPAAHFRHLRPDALERQARALTALRLIQPG